MPPTRRPQLLTSLGCAVFAHLGLAPAGWAQCDPGTVANLPGLSLDLGVSLDGQSLVVRDGPLHLFKWDPSSGTFFEEPSGPLPSAPTYGYTLARSEDLIVEVQSLSSITLRIYERTSTGWSGPTVLDTGNFGWFSFNSFGLGIAVSPDGQRIVAGSDFVHYGGGVVAVAERSVAGVWAWSGYYLASVSVGLPALGSDLDLSGDIVLAGAHLDGAGKVYVFRIVPGGAPARISTLDLGPAVAGTGFGKRVALSERWAVASFVATSAERVQVFERGPSSSFVPRYRVVLPAAIAHGEVLDLDLVEDRLVVVTGAGFAEFDLRADGAVVQRVTLAAASQARRALGGTVHFEGHDLVYSPSDLSMHSFCACDAAASCSADEPIGGCRNAAGTSAVLTACGAPSIVGDSLTLRVSDVPSGTLGTPFMGRAGSPTTLGNGQLCLHGSLYRFPTRAALGTSLDFSGLVAHSQVAHPSAAALAAGQTWSCQVWYRDVGGPCGATSNLSNALTVTFVP